MLSSYWYGGIPAGTVGPLLTEGGNMVTFAGTFGSFSVDDLEAAADFYGELLGMKVTLAGDHGPLWLHGVGGCDTLVYLKPDHAPATFTVLNLAVADVEQAVDELTSRGLTFDRPDGYDLDARGIFHGDGHALAWFTDPAGNSLSIVELG
jgi:catechol 2,3-dioxygenase-like lactoylglutathione lyase family enzyme